MMVIPLKWLPWLILIVGLITLAGGEAETGLVMIAVGGVWLFLRNLGKNKSNENTAQNSQSAPSARTSTPQATQPSQTAQTRQDTQTEQRVSFCPVCGARADSGATFCTSCGTKLTR